MYDVAKSNLQSEINQIENIAITHDMWTSANTELYGTTTCHYIKDTWEMKGVVLETKKMDGHHSFENMSHELESTRKAWNMSNVEFQRVTTSWISLWPEILEEAIVSVFLSEFQ
jgi:hypothetical protein